jgi:DNA-binding NtrC family response regulator
VVIDVLGAEADGQRLLVSTGPRSGGHLVERRQRMLVAVARQGFELCAARERPARVSGAAAEPTLEPLLPGFLCASAAMQRVVDHIRRLQSSDLTVLITGESGTGKELVARAIHAGSPRARAMFLPYNCTTTTRDLADSQLFGHRRGSFTGAVSDQPGLIRSAAGGTLFLDEIGDLPADVQPKLLRFLEQGEIMPVGETRPQRVEVRVLAATNADLEQRVGEGRFREDLYYRLSVIRIRVPALRERREEIPHLAMFFLREASERLAKPDIELSPAVLSVFSEYLWPGNVRQLRNEIQRAVALSAPGGTVTLDHLSPELAHMTDPNVPPPPTASPSRMAVARSLAAAVEQVEREMIQSTLDRTQGNISETARVLGLTRRGLYLKLRRLGMEQRFQMDTR